MASNQLARILTLIYSVYTQWPFYFILYISVLLLIALLALANLRTNLKSRPPKLARWKSVDFQRPAAQPYPEWNIHSTKPIPYRPFRWGAYHITMAIRKMHWDDWIELDNQYLTYHARKAERITQRGAYLSRTAPEAFDGACELLAELCGYLPQRYPDLFRGTETGMENLVTGEVFDIARRPLIEDPMQMIARMIQDDVALMFEKSDGQYYLLAATVMLPGAWRLKDKFGMSLSEIHISGDVPGYKTKLEKGMMNFFRRVQPTSPVTRNNYFFQMGNDLAWNRSLGPEDFDELSNDNAEKVKTVKHLWSVANEDKAIEHIHFRTERQSLRRLPNSGAIVFTFRSYLHPVTEIAQEPGVPGRLASAVRSWGPDTAKYKGRDGYQDALLEYLDARHQEQLKQGVVSQDDARENNLYPY